MSMELLSTMVTEPQIKLIIDNLLSVKHLNGDVVELGCNVGTTSVFIADNIGDKKFYVYDSFRGLPAKSALDGNGLYEEGMCKTDKDTFINNFKGRKLPIINEGWFTDCEYPDKICFAFLDGDFYSSIMDSLILVYPKIVKGGKILVHDYNYDELPGVKKACNDFLKNKKEVFECISNIGILVKK